MGYFKCSLNFLINIRVDRVDRFCRKMQAHGRRVASLMHYRHGSGASILAKRVLQPVTTLTITTEVKFDAYPGTSLSVSGNVACRSRSANEGDTRLWR